MKAQAKRGEGAALAAYPLSTALLPSRSAPLGCRRPAPPSLPFSHAFQGCWQSLTQNLDPQFKIYFLRAGNGFWGRFFFFYDSTTLPQQANTGPPAAPQNMAASAARPRPKGPPAFREQRPRQEKRVALHPRGHVSYGKWILRTITLSCLVLKVVVPWKANTPCNFW